MQDPIVRQSVSDNSLVQQNSAEEQNDPQATQVSHPDYRTESHATAAPAAKQHERWANMPLALREQRQWCVAGSDKRPYRVGANGVLYAASVTDPRTWTDFDTAAHYAAQNDAHIGYVLQEGCGVSCIDIDVKNASNEANSAKWTTQEQIDRYARIMDAFDCFTERSRSGLGLHIWVMGEIGNGKRRDGVELYSQERFIICTGDVVRDRPMRNQQYLLECLRADLSRGDDSEALELVEMEPLEDDETIFMRASKAANADKFNALCACTSATGEGDHKVNGSYTDLGYPSQSEADMALMTMFGFYSKSNEQCRRLFRMTGLGRREKATKDNRYLDSTLRKARSFEAADSGGANVEHGRELVEAILKNAMRKGRLTPNALDKKSSNFCLIPMDEIANRPMMKWLVRGVVPEEGVVAVYGPPSSGKSFLALDMLAAIASGRDWFGHKVRSAPGVYIGLEGKGGIPQRVKAYQARKGLMMNVKAIEEPMDLRNPADRAEIIRVVTEAGWDKGVLCIDTLAASSPGMDENASADMGALIAGLQEIQRAIGGCVMVVHHTGKDRDKGLRGWSGLNGALDGAIEVSRTGVKRSWKVAKSKDGEDGKEMPFCLETVQVDTYEDGEEITSCVIASDLPTVQAMALTDVVRDEEDDEFIWQWIDDDVKKGKFPSKNSLKSSLGAMKEQGSSITQARITGAIERLIACSRLHRESKSGNGNTWLRAVASTPLTEV